MAHIEVCVEQFSASGVQSSVLVCEITLRLAGLEGAALEF